MKTSGFQAHPTFLKVFVGQGIYIYMFENNMMVTNILRMRLQRMCFVEQKHLNDSVSRRHSLKRLEACRKSMNGPMPQGDG